MVWPLIAIALAMGVEVERVLALVNGVPILRSDVDLAEVAELVPRQPSEGDDEYRQAIVEALIALELRWQDLEAAGVPQRLQVDLEGAWARVEERAGGAEELAGRLRGIDLSTETLRNLVRRAAVVQAYVASRFAPFARATPREVEEAWQDELAPALEKEGKPVPELSAVRGEVEALLRERKLAAEIDRWTGELARRAEVVRYRR